MFVQMISSKPTNIVYTNLVLWCIIMLRVSCRKVGVLFLRSRSQQGFIWSWQFLLYLVNWWSFSYQTWFDSMPVCLVMKLDCCLHGLRLFTPDNRSRKRNIFSSNYTHSSWIVRFGYAFFNVWSDPYFWCPRGFSLFPIWRHESGLWRPMFLQLKIRQFRRKLVH